MVDYFKRLYAHAQWADTRTLRSIIESEHLPARALALLAHVLGAEHVWLSRVRGTTPRVTGSPTLSIAECDALMQENHSGYSALLDALDAGGLQRAVTVRNSAGHELTSTLQDILTHVAMHGCYHRGQVAALVRAAGDTPQPTDFIAFARGAPAAPKQGSQKPDDDR